MDLKKSTGDKLRELRGDMSQAAIAQKIGLTTSAWAMYERGERTPRDEAKIKIARHFGVSIGELFYGEK